jgi:hypothetical protein
LIEARLQWLGRVVEASRPYQQRAMMRDSIGICSLIYSFLRIINGIFSRDMCAAV